MINETQESKPTETSDAELVDRLANWAKQTLIVNAAQKKLDQIEAEVIAAYGERKRGIFSENAHVAFEKGRRTLEWQQAAMRAEIPPDRYKIYARPINIDWKKMYLDEGYDQDDVPFSRGPSKVKVSLIKEK